MKDLNFTELFCEILSGFFAILVSVLVLDCTGNLDFNETVAQTLNLQTFTVLIIVSYFVGLAVDAIGLSVGEWFLDKWMAKGEPEPSKSELETYYNKVSEVTSKYREIQWAYYSLYRNILILSVIGLPFYFYKASIDLGCTFMIFSVLIILLILVAICHSMRVLIKLFYKITKSIE